MVDNPSVVELPDPVIDNQPPTAPTGLTKGQVSETSASLTWTPSTDNFGVTGYDVYRDGYLVTSTTGGTTLAVAGNLVPSTTYQFTVRAKDASGNVSAPSSPLAMTTSPHVPTAPAPFPGDEQSRSQWLWDKTKAMLEEEGAINTASYVAQLGDHENVATNLGKLDRLYQLYDAEQYKTLSKMYGYLMVGDQYSPAMLTHVRSYFAQYAYGPLAQTENLRMSNYVTGYLVGQYLPDVSDLKGNSGNQLRSINKAAILAMIDAGVHRGWAEYESSEYTFMTYFGLNAIYQWADDPELVQKAKMAMDVMWFEWANDWIDGYRVSTESRAKETQPSPTIRPGAAPTMRSSPGRTSVPTGRSRASVSRTTWRRRPTARTWSTPAWWPGRGRSTRRRRSPCSSARRPTSPTPRTRRTCRTRAVAPWTSTGRPTSAPPGGWAPRSSTAGSTTGSKTCRWCCAGSPAPRNRCSACRSTWATPRSGPTTIRPSTG
ncbi:fibronectin type III domain-containing protein [Dactylosporangium darangshiense]|uniref:fibronectin type III domain-containing protein n=1 Tax=Dactylosporangium darangshiense TaxID=579108 RepID=UPI0036456E15